MYLCIIPCLWRRVYICKHRAPYVSESRVHLKPVSNIQMSQGHIILMIQMIEHMSIVTQSLVTWHKPVALYERYDMYDPNDEDMCSIIWCEVMIGWSKWNEITSEWSKWYKFMSMIQITRDHILTIPGDVCRYRRVCRELPHLWTDMWGRGGKLHLCLSPRLHTQGGQQHLWRQ